MSILFSQFFTFFILVLPSFVLLLQTLVTFTQYEQMTEVRNVNERKKLQIIKKNYSSGALNVTQKYHVLCRKVKTLFPLMKIKI